MFREELLLDFTSSSIWAHIRKAIRFVHPYLYTHKKALQADAGSRSVLCKFLKLCNKHALLHASTGKKTNSMDYNSWKTDALDLEQLINVSGRLDECHVSPH